MLKGSRPACRAMCAVYNLIRLSIWGEGVQLLNSPEQMCPLYGGVFNNLVSRPRFTLLPSGLSLTLMYNITRAYVFIYAGASRGARIEIYNEEGE